MLLWLQENRLKISSSLCILADALMGFAGAAGLYHIGTNSGDFLLTVAGGLGLFGHGINVFWGKGGKLKRKDTTAGNHKAQTRTLLRPFLIWRYPMDASFAVFVLGSLAFIMSGAASNNPVLVIFGCITLVSSLLGWLWPHDKAFFGFNIIQVCALLYMISGITCLISGIWAQKFLIVLAGFSYISANIVLYTVRKENQSLFTIDQNR